MQITVKGKKVIIEMDYDPANTYPLSPSGKSRTVDKTSGFITVPDAPAGPKGEVLKISLNLNLIIPKAERGT